MTNTGGNEVTFGSARVKPADAGSSAVFWESLLKFRYDAPKTSDRSSACVASLKIINSSNSGRLFRVADCHFTRGTANLALHAEGIENSKIPRIPRIPQNSGRNS